MRKRFLSALLVLCMVLTLFPSVAVAAPAITVYNEDDLIIAIADIDENGTITLGADIVLVDTLVIDGSKSFVIDLNGETLSNSSLETVIQYSGTGALTITDSSALGGKVETATYGVSTIGSSGVGKLIISGKATISSAGETILISKPVAPATPAPVVFEMTGGTVTGSNTSNAIANISTGAVHVTGGTITGGNGITSQYGAVNVSGGTVTGYLDSAIYAFNATVTLSGGTFRKISGYPGTAIRSAALAISGGSVIIDGGGNGATYAVPNLSGYTSYQWRTSSTGPYTLSTAQAYSYSSSHTYVEFQPYTPPPATYTVAYHPGTNGTGSEVTDTKTQDVALTLRGASFTRGGFTQTGWATTDGGAKAYDLGGSYTANAAIDLYPVWTSGTVVNTEADLISAIANINEYDTIKLGANIALTNILAIGGTKSFTIDLNGNTLSRNGSVIEYSGVGKTLTITDSSALGGGKVETTAASASAIVSAGVGNLVISGKATISSAYEAITILSPVTPFITVLQINSGTVVSTATANSAIVNNSYGQINALGGTITGGNGIVSTSTGNVLVRGCTVTGTSGTAISCGISNLSILGGSVIIEGASGAMTVAPNLTGYTSYQWRTSSTGDYTLSTTQAYTYSASHTYVEFQPYTPPATYTVAYHPGANGTGSGATDTKTQDVALTLRGALFTRGGFTQTGWATTDGGAKAYELGGSYTANAAIDLYPVWTSGILVNTEGGLAAAITNVAENGTIKLTGDITLSGTLTITGDKSFTIDLNGCTLSCAVTVIDYKGTGTLTITDSSTGGGTVTALSDTIVSDGNGKLTVSGKAAVTSEFTAISISGGAAAAGKDVLEIAGGTVTTTSTTNAAIVNRSDGTVTVSGGTVTGAAGIDSIYHTGGVIVSGGTVKGTDSSSISASGNVTLTGGTLESNGSSNEVIYCSDAQIFIPGGTVLIKGGSSAMSKAPDLTGYANYQWRTASDGIFTPSTTQAYPYDASHTYVEIKPYYTAPTSYSVAYHPGANGTGSGATDTKTQDVALTLRGALFTREGFTQTGWAITDGGVQNYTLGGSYTANAAITLYPVWTQNMPNTYTVTLPTGTGYTVAAQAGSSSPVTSGGSYSFTVSMNSGYHKGNDFAVKANGTPLTADDTGVYTLSNITQTQAVTVEGVVQDTTEASGGGHVSPAVTTVYNDPSIPNATIWISGNGFSRNDLLVTQSITSGSDYNALLKLADKDDVLRVYNITLQSGKKSTGSAMYLTFDLTGQYAGQAFTLVHKKADGTFENLYATADKDGKVKFGPVYELSPFMLVKGSLLYVPTEEVVNAPKTGDASNSLLFVLLSLAAVCGAGMVVYRKKQA